MAYSPSDISMSWVDYRINAIMTCDHTYSEQLTISGFFPHLAVHGYDTEMVSPASKSAAQSSHLPPA